MTLVCALIFLAPYFAGSAVGPTPTMAQTAAPGGDEAEEDPGRPATPFSQLMKPGGGGEAEKSDTLKSFLEKFLACSC